MMSGYRGCMCRCEFIQDHNKTWFEIKMEHTKLKLEDKMMEHNGQMNMAVGSDVCGGVG